MQRCFAFSRLAGPRVTTCRPPHAGLVGSAILSFVTARCLAADDTAEVPPRSADEKILDKIDQLQRQLDELRAELAASRSEKDSAVTALREVSAPAALDAHHPGSELLRPRFVLPPSQQGTSYSTWRTRLPLPAARSPWFR